MYNKTSLSSFEILYFSSSTQQNTRCHCTSIRHIFIHCHFLGFSISESRSLAWRDGKAGWRAGCVKVRSHGRINFKLLRHRNRSRTEWSQSQSMAQPQGLFTRCDFFWVRLHFLIKSQSYSVNSVIDIHTTHSMRCIKTQSTQKKSEVPSLQVFPGRGAPTPEHGGRWKLHGNEKMDGEAGVRFPHAP